MNTNREVVWGYHLMLDCSGGDKSAVTNPELIAEFTKRLVSEIDMIAYGEPQIVHFADHCPAKAGYTLIQLIETSNICCHFIDKTGDFFLDVFSCKEFNPEDVKKVVEIYFQPRKMKEHWFVRASDAIE